MQWNEIDFEIREVEKANEIEIILRWFQTN